MNDYSGMLTEERRELLEQRLVSFSDTTSNQVVVIITPTLGGDDENAVAQRIGQTWGVGQEKYNNGVVILIKSKTEEENWGAVAIATGYGVEGVLPDVFCKRIIDDHMLGYLGDGHYYEAICSALDIIEPVLVGEYSYELYRKAEKSESTFTTVFSLLLVAGGIWAFCLRGKRARRLWGSGGGGYSSSSSDDYYDSGSSSSSYSSGSSSSFGGGSFGGGGASGRF